MPRYENTTTGKYAEIDSFGYIREGNSGHSKPVKFKTISIEEADKIKNRLLENGFIESGLNGTVWDFEPNTAIEDKILSNTDEKAHYLEYADWLKINGQIEFSEFIRSNNFECDNNKLRQFFGEISCASGIKKWRHGFVQDFQLVSNHDINEISQFLNLPILKFLESSSVHQASIPEFLEFIKSWGGLRKLKKLNIWDEENCGIGNLNEILPALNHLQYFYLVGTIYEPGETEEIEIKNIDCPELLHFARVSPDLTVKELKKISHAKLPMLEALTLGTGFNSEISAEDFICLLKSENLKSLKRLDIRHFDDIDNLIPLLASSPLLTQLTELGFYQSNLSNKGAQALIQYKDKFSHLQSMDISETRLTEDDENKLLKAFNSIKPYNRFREEGEQPYIDAIYQENFWETDPDEDCFIMN